jgi:DNA polymerase-3 subunit epsilon
MANAWQQPSLLTALSPETPADLPDRLLIIDTETTGLDPDRHHCLEVGAILFSVPQRSVLTQLSFLLPVRSNPARAVNGIDPRATQEPHPWQQSLYLLETMASAAHVAVAHNASFDKRWFGLGQLPQFNLPWLCSMDDIFWPKSLGLRPRPSLRDLALAHSIPVWAAHRALTDCTYLAQVFERCNDLEILLKDALEPRQLYRALVSYVDRQLAKEHGFRWNDPVKGAWTRRLSERQITSLEFPFQIDIMAS